MKVNMKRPPSCRLKLHDGSYDFSLASVLALKPVCLEVSGFVCICFVWERRRRGLLPTNNNFYHP